ncbi:hypothetical protein CLM82_29505, partial [Streptomyces albidoflavus]
AAIGTFTAGTPVPEPMRRSIEKLIAWKLALTQADPVANTHLLTCAPPVHPEKPERRPGSRGRRLGET